MSLEEGKQFSPNIKENSSDYWKKVYRNCTEFDWVALDSNTRVFGQKQFINTGQKHPENPLLGEDEYIYSTCGSKLTYQSGKRTFRIRIVRAKQYQVFCSNTLFGFVGGMSRIIIRGNGTIDPQPEGFDFFEQKIGFQTGDAVDCTLDYTRGSTLVTFQVISEKMNPMRKSYTVKFPFMHFRLNARLNRAGDTLKVESVVNHEFS